MHEPGRYWQQVVIWVALAGAAYVFWRWLVWYLLPFVLAVILTAMVMPVVERLESWGFRRTGAVLTALGGALGGLVLLSGAVFTLLAAELVQISHRMPHFLDRPGQVARYLKQWNQLREQLGLGNANLGTEMHSLYNVAAAMGRTVAHGLLQLPEMALVMIVASVAAFFMLRDQTVVLRQVKQLSPPFLRPRMGRLTLAMTGGLWGYLRAQFALVSLTGLATMGGLLVIGAPYAVLVGLTAGLLDLVPFMGPTMLLVPWAMVAMLSGHAAMAVHLLAVLAGVALVRQLVEPRLVGRGTGLHPLVVLFSLYMGIRLFGGSGVLIGPITAVMFNAIRQASRYSGPSVRG